MRKDNKYIKKRRINLNEKIDIVILNKMLTLSNTNKNTQIISLYSFVKSLIDTFKNDNYILNKINNIIERSINFYTLDYNIKYMNSPEASDDFIINKSKEIINKGEHTFRLPGYFICSKLLGKGGFSKVFLGYDQNNNNNKVAIKCIPKNNKNSSLLVNKEVNILKKISNIPNTLKYYNNLEDSSFYFIITEYFDGIRLSDIINKEKLSLSKIKYIFLSIINTIIKYNEPPLLIIHRDLKPSNILIKKDLSDILLIDFGLSVEFKNNNNNNNNNNIKVKDESNIPSASIIGVAGTFMYLAPELLNNNKKNPYDGIKSDIYSLGVILYELVENSKPFTVDEKKEAYVNKNSTNENIKITFNRNIDITINNLILNMLQTNPNDRSNLYEIKSILENIDCDILVNKF
jgi:serine/threonine protein kinase